MTIIQCTKGAEKYIEAYLSDEDHTIEHKDYVFFLIKVRDEHQKLKELDYLVIGKYGKYVIQKELYNTLHDSGTLK